MPVFLPSQTICFIWNAGGICQRGRLFSSCLCFDDQSCAYSVDSELPRECWQTYEASWAALCSSREIRRSWRLCSTMGHNITLLTKVKDSAESGWDQIKGAGSFLFLRRAVCLKLYCSVVAAGMVDFAKVEKIY